LNYKLLPATDQLILMLRFRNIFASTDCSSQTPSAASFDLRIPGSFDMAPNAMGDSGQLPEISTPLSDADTEKNLRFIEDLHKLGVSKYIDMPQVHFTY
jgi:hypothetical protein